MPSSGCHPGVQPINVVCLVDDAHLKCPLGGVGRSAQIRRRDRAIAHRRSRGSGAIRSHVRSPVPGAPWISWQNHGPRERWQGRQPTCCFRRSRCERESPVARAIRRLLHRSSLWRASRVHATVEALMSGVEICSLAVSTTRAEIFRRTVNPLLGGIRHDARQAPIPPNRGDRLGTSLAVPNRVADHIGTPTEGQSGCEAG